MSGRHLSWVGVPGGGALVTGVVSNRGDLRRPHPRLAFRPLFLLLSAARPARPPTAARPRPRLRSPQGAR